MGYEKNKMIEYQDRGYGHSEKYFCTDCFGDKFLKRYIRRYGSKGQCSFCKNSSGRAVERNVVPVDEIMEIISKVIHRDYKPALGWAIYDPEEERYLESVLDPYDFVRDELNQYMECENDEVLDEIMDTLQCEDRISTKEWRTKQGETDMKEWEKFCKLVRNSALSAEQIVTECGRERASENLQEITIGRFHTNKEIGVLDLTEFTDCELRSIFDVENSDKQSMFKEKQDYRESFITVQNFLFKKKMVYRSIGKMWCYL